MDEFLFALSIILGIIYTFLKITKAIKNDFGFSRREVIFIATIICLAAYIIA